MACWAWSGRSSKLAIRSIESSDIDNEPIANGSGIGKGPLGGEGKVIDTGKGKFGMDVRFVSCIFVLVWDVELMISQSPDGKQLALATETGHIIVLDTETQAVVATYTSHAMAVRTLSWSPDSQVGSDVY